jgi:hypothetical protein
VSFDWTAAPAPWPAHRLRTREDLRRDVDAGILTTILVVLLGAPLGLLWAAVRPHSDLFLLVAEDAREQQHFSADLRFAAVVAIGGLVAGLAGYLVARSGGTGVAVGLAIGGLLAAVVAERVGIRAAHQDELRSALAQAFQAHGYSLTGQRPQDQLSYLADTRFELRAWPLVAALPAAAVATFGALTWTRDRTSPRAHVPMSPAASPPWGAPSEDVVDPGAAPPPSRWG